MSVPVVAVRPCRPEDVAAVLEIWREGAAEPTVTDDAAAVRLLVRRDADALLLALLDGRPAGTVIAGWDGWRGNLYRLAVLPDARRRGVARALVTAAEERLRSLGARRIHAGALVEHPGAVATWHALGYAPDPRIGRFTKTL